MQHRSLWWNLDAPSGEQAVTLPWTCLNVSKFFVSFGTPTSCNRDLHALNDVFVCKQFGLPSIVKQADEPKMVYFLIQFGLAPIVKQAYEPEMMYCFNATNTKKIKK